MSELLEFTIYPVLGRKTSVPADSPTLFQQVGENAAATHDAGGINFDLRRKRNACSKSFGYTQWSNSANTQATKCLGLFELYDGSDRNYIYFDNGKFYYYDSSFDPQVIQDSGSTTFATDNVDLYSIVRVGEYVVFTDRGEHTPYKWSNGDANLTKLIQSGTEYTFRWLEVFRRRVIGIYSDQANGDIEIRWSTSWPTTAIGSLNFPSDNQLYIPNDDSLVGGKVMTKDRCFLYSLNSIHSLDYTRLYDTPFSIRTVVNGQGAVNHHSIVNLGDRHYLFNKYYGFCEFRGQQFPYGQRPISEDIEIDLQDVNTEYMNLIVGTYLPLTREVCWIVPWSGHPTPNRFVYYDIDTRQWRIEDKEAHYVDAWRMYDNFTWNDFISEIGGTGIWSDAGSNTWADYTHHKTRLVHGHEDGHLYYQYGETDNGSHIDGYRIEPVLDFGDSTRKDTLSEIWFSIGKAGSFSIDVYHRSGETLGELEDESWTSVGSISCNNPATPKINVNQTARLHQIKWGTDLGDEKFEVNKIVFKFIPQSNY